MKTTKKQFIEWAMDCMGYGEDDAFELAEEWRGDILAFAGKEYKEDIKNYLGL